MKFHHPWEDCFGHHLKKKLSTPMVNAQTEPLKLKSRILSLKTPFHIK